MFDRVFDLDGTDLPGIVDAFSTSAGDGGAQLWFADENRESLVGDAQLAGRLPAANAGGDFRCTWTRTFRPARPTPIWCGTVDYDVEKVRRSPSGHARPYRDDGKDEDGAVPTNNGDRRLERPRGRVVELGATRMTRRRRHGYKVFGGSVYVPPDGGGDELVFQYRLPDSVADDYTFEWIRQAGTTDDVLTATISRKRVEFPSRGASPPGQRHPPLRGSARRDRCQQGFTFR